MKRLIKRTVFPGFVMPCRFATWPTRISPSFVNPTTEGVRRLPSWFAITVGLPPSTTATTEFVVPRSMPMTFAMSLLPFFFGGGLDGPPDAPLLHVVLDFLGLHRFHLGQPDLQHPVPVRPLHLFRLPRDGQ